MSVETKYVVVRGNKEIMTFIEKKEADAYDKMLDISEELFTYMKPILTNVDEEKLEEICVFLAKEKDDLARLLKGTKVEKLNNQKKIKTTIDKTTIDKTTIDKTTIDKTTDEIEIINS